MALVTKQYVLINLRLIDITGIFRIQSNIYNQAFLRKYLASVRFSKKFRKIHRKTPLPEFFRYLHDNRIERTYRRTLSSDDLTFFNFQSYFLLKKEKISNFRFDSIFIFNKKELQSCEFATYRRNALFVFLTSQTG